MKNAFQITLLTVTLLLTACSPKIETVEVKNDDGQVIETVEITKEDGKKNGIRKKYDDKGILTLEETYKADVLEGKRTFFYENGQPKEVETYENDVLVGVVIAYDKKGNIRNKTPYVNKSGRSILEGVAERYYANGQLLEKVTFVQNVLNGPFEEYYENGQPKAKGVFVEDRFGEQAEQGILEMFDSTGVLVKKMECDTGRCATIWTKEE